MSDSSKPIILRFYAEDALGENGYATLGHELARLRRESQRAADLLDERDAQVAELTRRLDEVVPPNTAYKALKSRVVELQNKLDMADADSEQQALEIAELRHSLERVTEQRDELRKRLNDAHECINHWETQSGDDHASFATRTVRIDYYQPLYVKAEAEVADLKRQLHESHSPFVNMAKEQSEARARIADLEKQLAEAKAATDAGLQMRLDEAEAKCDRLESRLEQEQDRVGTLMANVMSALNSVRS